MQKALMRVPSIKFIGRRVAPTVPHKAGPHPMSSAELIADFAGFQARQAVVRGVKSAGTKSGLLNSWEIPEKYSRARFLPTDREMRLVESGGAADFGGW